jgi:hypothetical protein
VNQIGFQEFVDGVRARSAQSDDGGLVARRVRDWLRQALVSPRFAFDCIERVLATMGPAGTPWRNLTIHDDDEGGYNVRVFYWAPGFANRPHQHACDGQSWTVTGVLHNALTFVTYEERGGQLVVDKRIESLGGDAGYIVTPCIHNVANETKSTSVSVHLFRGPKTASGRGYSTWYGGAPSPVIDAEGPNAGSDHRERALSAFVSIAAKTDEARRLSILDRAFSLGSLPVKLAVAKALAPVSSSLAADKLEALAPLCPPHVARELERLGQNLRRASIA